MKLRNLFAFAASFFAVKLFFEALAKSQVKLKTMAIKREELEALLLIQGVKGLQFSSDYDNKTLSKDHITLHMYKDTGGEPMRTLPVEIIENGREINNERKYSSYGISVDQIRAILARYPQEPKPSYFLLMPRPYDEDKSHVTYDIVPADAEKVPYRKRTLAATSVNRAEMAMAQDSDQSGVPDTMDGELQYTVNAATALSLSYEVVGALNPSPPAKPAY